MQSQVLSETQAPMMGEMLSRTLQDQWVYVRHPKDKLCMDQNIPLSFIYARYGGSILARPRHFDIPLSCDQARRSFLSKLDPI